MAHSYDSKAGNQWAAALEDLAGVFTHWRSWFTLGTHDIKHKYRGSVLGPFWITLSMAILIGGLTLIYGPVSGSSDWTYVTYLSISLPLWYLLSDSIRDGCVCFSSEPLLKQIKLPYSVYVVRVMWRNLVIFLHNLVIFIVVALFGGIKDGPHILLAVLGLVILFANIGWMILVFGTICTRFRDVTQIIGNFVGMLFFVSPIMWAPSLVKGRSYIVEVNILNHIMETVRQPVLGSVPSLSNYLVSLASAVIGWAITLALFTKFRRRLPYWA